MPSKLDLLKARVRSIKSTLKATSANEKGNHATLTIVGNFNKIIEDAAATFPDLKDSLPSPIKTGEGHFEDMGVSDATYLDIELLADQLIAILDLCEGE